MTFDEAQRAGVVNMLPHDEPLLMTAYTITVGYNSAHDKEAVAKRLREVVRELQADPIRIAREVTRIRPEIKEEELASFCDSYRPPVEDLTLQIKNAAGVCEVIQLASSMNGVRSRELKEECRRAVFRLVLEAMHRDGMEINLVVS